MENAGLALEVRVHNSQLREISHKNKTYIGAKSGSEYSIRIRNDRPDRVLAVISVDGLSVIEGEPASHESGGYVLEPWSYADIPGWRLDDTRVAKFRFGSKHTSYLARTLDGKARDAGVIGCAFFLEKPLTPAYNIHYHYPTTFYQQTTPMPPRTITCSSSLQTSESCADQSTQSSDMVTACYNSAEAVQHDLGTEFGGKSVFSVASTNFVKSSADPFQVLEIYYASHEALRAAGISLNKRPRVYVPQTFRNTKGCTPPKGWRGCA